MDDQIEGIWDESTEERLLHRRARWPRRGWRRWVYRLTGGLLAPGASPAQRRRQALETAIQTPFRGTRVVAVISPKGGVGTTTVTVGLGHVLAALRTDRVVALDTDSDPGTLGFRVPRRTRASRAELAVAGPISTYGEMAAYTHAAPSRLNVVSGAADARAWRAMEPAEYPRLLGVVEQYYSLILVDSRTDVLDELTTAVLDSADGLVLVTAPSLDAARSASALLDRLEADGRHALVAGAVTVINGIDVRQRRIDLDALEGHFAQRCRETIRVPWDPYLADGTDVDLQRCRRATRAAYEQLGAAVARAFGPAAGPSREPPPPVADTLLAIEAGV
jgi:MinD-like ATPase involved in chromosome partitioning or flagellar assembly